jgi:hypothetical protein
MDISMPPPGLQSPINSLSTESWRVLNEESEISPATKKKYNSVRVIDNSDRTPIDDLNES